MKNQIVVQFINVEFRNYFKPYIEGNDFFKLKCNFKLFPGLSLRKKAESVFKTFKGCPIHIVEVLLKSIYSRALI